MGLAEPRKRIKISHDPRNLAWSQSTSSYGQRLMQQQGWQEGQSLGARSKLQGTSTEEDAARLAASRVGVLYKDDTLGLGAQLRSKDVQNQRTGLDAFQGLLGRLNAKDEAEVKEAEKKVEDKKLALFAQGRWGGMVFVPGGVLVQGDEFKRKDLKAKLEREEAEEQARKAAISADPNPVRSEELDSDADSDISGARRKAEKKARKEERRAKKEARRLKKAAKVTGSEGPTPQDSTQVSSDETSGIRNGPPKDKSSSRISSKSKNLSAQRAAPDEAVSSAEEDGNVSTRGVVEKSKSVTSSAQSISQQKLAAVSTLASTGNTPTHTNSNTPSSSRPSTPVLVTSRNGRHLLRGRNIQAKRMAFSDAKGLDEIFMRGAVPAASAS